ncbi:Hypothetical predicted protein [Mytilus galloprovincialis]|uniref:BZIP domain-containing protein n=1 Tax=Mytilus galloprovincialis TaxID=29158 RepID=A0A8B6FI88_MYTGA|nr:Hypothetical predicted protein [Mytilus galloprovincialis]
MVRLMCQNFICQDGGDTVDQKRAEKAVTALLKTEDKTTFQTFFSETDSGTSSDSTTHEVARDGESDTDEERLIIEIKEEAIRTGQTESEVNNQRKDRRRERNKRSAKAYRKRRREHKSTVDEQVEKIEEEKNIVLGMLKTKIKIPWPYPIWMGPYPSGMSSTMDGSMSTQIGMNSVVQEVTVAS